jgi:hypothetical protein
LKRPAAGFRRLGRRQWPPPPPLSRPSPSSIARIGHRHAQSLGQRRHVDIDLPSRARSIMFSATTVGTPNESTWLTKNRFRSRLLASTIESTTSTGASSARRPKSSSTTTISSGERGAKLYVPGKSISSNVWPS